MELREEPYIYRGEHYGTRYYYADVEPEAIPREPGVRVLPAQYYFEKRLMFVLIKRYEPGEHKLFPNGGYDIRDEGGGVRSYNLNEVVIHPQVFHYKNHLAKVAKKYEKEAEKRAKKEAKYQKKMAKGKRGRPSATPEQIEARKQFQAERVKTGKRGRPGLSPEEKAAREAEKARKSSISGGKRGRPKKVVVA
jgi:hypothetical protein